LEIIINVRPGIETLDAALAYQFGEGRINSLMLRERRVICSHVREELRSPLGVIDGVNKRDLIEYQQHLL
jgi:hypothetical protein